MDANDEFQDAVDEPQYEEQEDGSLLYTDHDGYQVQLPKAWGLHNSFTFDDDGLKEIVTNAHPGNCSITDEMRKVKPQGKFHSITLKIYRSFFQSQ